MYSRCKGWYSYVINRQSHAFSYKSRINLASFSCNYLIANDTIIILEMHLITYKNYGYKFSIRIRRLVSIVQSVKTHFM